MDYGGSYGWLAGITTILITHQMPFCVRIEATAFLRDSLDTSNRNTFKVVSTGGGWMSGWVLKHEEHRAVDSLSWGCSVTTLPMHTPAFFPTDPWEHVFWCLLISAFLGTHDYLPWGFLRIQSKCSTSCHSELNREAIQAKSIVNVTESQFPYILTIFSVWLGNIPYQNPYPEKALPGLLLWFQAHVSLFPTT